MIVRNILKVTQKSKDLEKIRYHVFRNTCTANAKGTQLLITLSSWPVCIICMNANNMCSFQ